MIRTLLIVALGTTLAAATACGGDDDDSTAGQAPPATETSGPATETRESSLPANLTTIRVVDNSYSPTGLQVPVGTRVTWTWEGVAPHTVSGSFNGEVVESGVMETGGEFEFEFTSAGLFEYECLVHGSVMSGTVRVQ